MSNDSHNAEAQNKTYDNNEPVKDQGAAEGQQLPDWALVGIGASAGGFNAIKGFLQHLPEKPGMPFVVIMHLSPERESHLAELLQSYSKIPVQQVTETVALEPDKVYVIPPNANLDSVDTHLRLSELENQARNRSPIDHFFRTMSETHDARTIGIVLSGTGTDGTRGLRWIKEAGGLTMVQSPSEAEYDGMPRSALAGMMVDLESKVADMPEHILHFSRSRPQFPVREEEEKLPEDEHRVLQKIYAYIRSRTGRDFSSYKRSTILRRIQRRMQIHRLDTLSGYLEVLKKQDDEVRYLFDDLLITVTEFFRDREVFAQLENKIIPRLFKGKSERDQIRVWSVGCATGEEAYSLAMLLTEEAAKHEVSPQMQLFATDLHERSLDMAREGLYPESIAENVSAKRLQRFFVQEDSSYRVRKELREMVIFAPHDLLSDPPFSHMDLIVCRNLLIYLQRDVQQDVMSLFHYALEPEGLMVLGKSETVDPSDLFIREDKAYSLYRRRNVTDSEPRLPVFTAGPRPHQPEHHVEDKQQRPKGHGQLHARMVERYAPPSILINAGNEVVHYSEQAGQYIQTPGGEPTNNVFKLLREPLQLELRAAMESARSSGTMTRSKPVTIPVNGRKERVIMRVQPSNDPDIDGYFLVIFDPAGEVEALEESDPDREQTSTVRELEAELDLTRKRLKTITEEYETSQEEMQASNEELQSANEELRSTMEELETSKEELQSMNEELSTVNQENRHQVAELKQLYSDMNNLVNATGIATLFIDRELKIVRFTPTADKLFNIRPSDKGRPLSDLTHQLVNADLENVARSVLHNLSPMDKEIRDREGNWFLMRTRPYRTEDDRIEGVVISFMRQRELFQQIIEHIPVLIVLWDSNLQQFTLNAHAEKVLGWTTADANEGDFMAKVYPGEEYRLKVCEYMRSLESGWEEWLCTTKDGRQIPIDWSNVRLDDDSMIGIGVDLEERKAAEAALRESEQRFRILVEAAAQAVWETNATGEVVADSPSWQAYTGQTFDEFKDFGWIAAVHPEDRELARHKWQEAVDQVQPLDMEFRLRTADGEWRWTNARAAPLFDEEGTVIKWVGMNIDITERREAVEALQKAHDELEQRVAERTAELVQQKRRLSRLARELASAEHRERKRLAAVLHDELQQYLVAVKIHANMAGQHIEDEAAEPLLGECKRLVDQAIECSQDLTRQLRPPVLYEDGLVPALRWLGSEMAERHGLVTTIDSNVTQTPFNDDVRAMLFESVRELLFNVVKHAQVSEAAVDIQLEEDHLYLTVSDQGAGITTAKAEEKKPERGGLGLFSIRERLEMMGGEMRIVSAPGEGTSVTLSMPVPMAQEEEAEEEETAATSAPPLQRRKTAGPQTNQAGSTAVRVLLVDDHAIVRHGIVNVLDADERVEVIGEAADGEEAIHAVEQLQPDVVLMDVNLPKINGIEATREIRERWPEIRVLGLSVHNDVATAQSMMEAGANGLLSKAEHTDRIVEAIMVAAKRKKS